MKADKTLPGTVLCALFFSFFAHASSDPVQVGSSGYWASGILLGKKGSVNVNWLGSIGLDFFWGSDSEAKDENYFSHVLEPTYMHGTYAVMSRFKDTVVLDYISPNPLNPLYWFRCKFFAKHVEKACSDFSKTSSGQRYGRTFREPFPSHHGRWEAGRKRGKFIRVSRWGTELFGRICTVWLHEGSKQKVVKKKHANTSLKYDTDTNNYQSSMSMESNDATVSTPTVTPLNIYSESGCLFAEDAARSMALVAVDYSSALFEIWNRYPLTIHGMRVDEQNNSSSKASGYASNVSNLPSSASRGDKSDIATPTPQLRSRPLKRRHKKRSIESQGEVQSIQEPEDSKPGYWIGSKLRQPSQVLYPGCSFPWHR